MGSKDITLLQALLMLIFFLWIVGLGFAVIFRKHKNYWEGTKKYIQVMYKRHWKLFLGIFLGWLLTVA